MDLLTRDHLRAIIQAKDHPCVSIFLPTAKTWPKVQANQERFRNLLLEAERRLLTDGLQHKDVLSLLERPRALLEQELFWRYQESGLALFVSPSHFSMFRLPTSFDEQVFIADHFHITPLFPLHEDELFFVLALSQKQVRLLRGTARGAHEVFIKEFHNLREALHEEVQEKLMEAHTVTAGGGKNVPILHGMGAPRDIKKERLTEYLRMIDGHLAGILHGYAAPLVVAAVDEVFVLYRDVCSYSHLLREHISGSPDRLSEAELWQRGLCIAEPHLHADEEQAKKQVKQSRGIKNNVTDLAAILEAAHQGKVDRLLISKDSMQAGTFDSVNNVVEYHEAFQPGDRDLIDEAAVQTLLHDGTVDALRSEEHPAPSGIAAILRY